MFKKPQNLKDLTVNLVLVLFKQCSHVQIFYFFVERILMDSSYILWNKIQDYQFRFILTNHFLVTAWPVICRVVLILFTDCQTTWLIVLSTIIIIIVISIGDFQIRWNALSLSFSGTESGKLPLGLSDFHHNYLISNDCIQHSGKIFIYNT